MALRARNAQEGLSPIRSEPGLTGDDIVIPISWTVANALCLGPVCVAQVEYFPRIGTRQSMGGIL